jgi:hypothetical protein
MHQHPAGKQARFYCHAAGCFNSSHMALVTTCLINWPLRAEPCTEPMACAPHTVWVRVQWGALASGTGHTANCLPEQQRVHLPVTSMAARGDKWGRHTVTQAGDTHLSSCLRCPPPVRPSYPLKAAAWPVPSPNILDCEEGGPRHPSLYQRSPADPPRQPPSPGFCPRTLTTNGAPAGASWSQVGAA